MPCITPKLTGRENKSRVQCTDKIEKMLTHHNLSDQVQLRAELQIFDLAFDLTQLLRSQYALGLKGHKTSCHHRSFAKTKSINDYQAFKYYSNNQCRQKETRNSFKMHTKRKSSNGHFQVPKRKGGGKQEKRDYFEIIKRKKYKTNTVDVELCAYKLALLDPDLPRDHF